ncbi:MAG: TolC family protein [Chitinophagaceae bacterium]
MLHLNIFLISLLYSFNVIQKEDSLKVLSEASFISIVRNYHPVVKQSDLIVERAKAELTTARAGFDPYAVISNDKKTFDGKNYYDYSNASVKIPTWYGIEVKAGLEENLGNLLNPEYTTGQSNYLGISIPLIKNLVIDKRRATLQQAKIIKEQSQAEKLVIINDLINDAYISYWNCVKEYEIYALYNEIIALNQQRLQLIINTYIQGDRPAIDTVEALAQIQTLQLNRQQAWMKYIAATLDLSGFLWNGNGNPIYIDDMVIPDQVWAKNNPASLSNPNLNDLMTGAMTNHPKLKGLEYKKNTLYVEKKLKFQELLPSLDIKYNLLGKGYFQSNFNNSVLFSNNYKYGFDFSLPLRLSKGRGEYQEAKIKIRENEIQRMQLELSISNKIKYYFNEILNLRKQYDLAKNSADNYQKLLTAELTRFQIGESSMFLINSRENKYLEMKQKLIEVHTKLLLSYRSIDWATGSLR